MDYDEQYFERRLNEAHEIFTSKQVREFATRCINDAKSRLSPRNSDMEKELSIRLGYLKTIPEILSTGNLDSKEYRKAENVFYRILKEYTVDFDDELRKIREYYAEHPLESTYKIYYLTNSKFGIDELTISTKTDTVIFTQEEGTTEFELIDGRKFIIPTENKETREVDLDRPISEVFEEIICGTESLIDVDRTLIRKNKIVFVIDSINLKSIHLEHIALFLANEKLQKYIYPQDIFLLSQFEKEVQRFRYNNRWFKIVMPKVLVDAYSKYLYHFKSYVFDEKGLEININFINEADFIILQIDSRDQVNEYVIGEWLEEFMSFLLGDEREESIFETKDPITAKKLRIQIRRFHEDIGLEEMRFNTSIDTDDQVAKILQQIGRDKSSMINLIIYGGNQQFADKIINQLKLE